MGREYVLITNHSTTIKPNKSNMRILVLEGNKIEIDLLSLFSGKETVYYNGEIVSQKRVVCTHSQLKKMESMPTMLSKLEWVYPCELR
jgi:hypothetical protein